MAKKKIEQGREVYASRGKRSKDFSGIGKPESLSLGDMSMGNDGTSSNWTPPPSGKAEPGYTAGKTKSSNPSEPVQTPPTESGSSDSSEPETMESQPVPVAGVN